MFQRPPSDIALSSNNYDEKENSVDTVETVVGPSVNVEGDFSSEGNILVKGTVSGNVRTSKLLTVEKGAKILANIQAGSAVISGEIRGNIKVIEKLELLATARIGGDLQCDVLVVEAGAMLQGKISMGANIEDEFVKPEKKRGFLKSKSKLPENQEVSLSFEENV